MHERMSFPGAVYSSGTRRGVLGRALQGCQCFSCLCVQLPRLPGQRSVRPSAHQSCTGTAMFRTLRASMTSLFSTLLTHLPSPLFHSPHPKAMGSARLLFRSRTGSVTTVPDRLSGVACFHAHVLGLAAMYGLAVRSCQMLHQPLSRALGCTGFARTFEP